jgi:hypothetical protein
MISSQSLTPKVLAAATLLLLADAAPELRVLRVVPSEDAAPTVPVIITVDRPVATEPWTLGRSSASRPPWRATWTGAIR